MKAVLRNIPNFITCLNLLSGCLGIMFLMYDGISESIAPTQAACYCVFAALLFDFLDGLVARLLHVTSNIGKDLDSLADVVSFGVLPALIMMHLYIGIHGSHPHAFLIACIYLIIPVCGAIRLARFNNDTTQSFSFKGLPIPANGIMIASIGVYILSKGLVFSMQMKYSSGFDQSYHPSYVGLAQVYTHPFFMLSLPVILSFLMVSPFRLMAFKIKNFTFKKYLFHFIFLSFSLLLGLLLGFASAPIILLLYFIFSFLHFRFNNHEVQSGN